METERPVRLYCRANTNLNAAVRGDKVVLVAADSSDTSQHWIQDYDSVGKLTDDQGRRAFALVNRATGQAMVSKTSELQLAPYRGHERVEISMLWSLGVKLDSGFSVVRLLRDMSRTLNVTNGWVKEGAPLQLYLPEPHRDHSIWMIDPINEG